MKRFCFQLAFWMITIGVFIDGEIMFRTLGRIGKFAYLTLVLT